MIGTIGLVAIASLPPFAGFLGEGLLISVEFMYIRVGGIFVQKDFSLPLKLSR